MKKHIIIAIICFLISLILFVYAYFLYLQASKAIVLHNLGNEVFISGDLEQSILYYSGSLKIQEHSDTRFNYDYVKQLIHQEEAQKQEHGEDENSSQTNEESGEMQQQNNSQENSNNQEQNQSEESDTSESTQNTQGNTGERDQEYKLEASQNIDELSQEERDILEQELQRIEQDQLINQKYFNKKQQGISDPFEQMQKRFFGEIYRGGEKDW